jgi:hypothetical protein
MTQAAYRPYTPSHIRLRDRDNFTFILLEPTYPLPHSIWVPNPEGATISRPCLIPLLHIHRSPLLDAARPGAFCPKRPSCFPVAFRRGSGLWHFTRMCHIWRILGKKRCGITGRRSDTRKLIGALRNF